MEKKIGGLEIGDYAALLVRLSMVSTSPKKLAAQLRKSDSLVRKWMEGDEPQTPNLEQWLEAVLFSRDLEGVRRLAQDLGFVCVRQGATLAATLRELAEELEAGATGNLRPAQMRFPRAVEG